MLADDGDFLRKGSLGVFLNLDAQSSQEEEEEEEEKGNYWSVKMIQLLLLVLLSEGVLAFLLVVKIGPLRELVMNGLDQLKTMKGTVLTIAGVFCAILLSHFFSIVRIQNKGAKLGTMTPMDQVLWRTNLLEATLIGFSLFLGFLIDRIHFYIRELIELQSGAATSKDEVGKLEKEKVVFNERAKQAEEEVKQLQKEISCLKDEVKTAKEECEKKGKRIQTAEENVNSLQNQTAALLLEYDRLLEENQELQRQAAGTPARFI
ncbi:unnamed protein product [Cuscuta campestris]|uniref:Endoplasmic reticulum transmembrane protein n=1 Tax=Cuscuta campestris TaxID=132261 RepID=A0A484N3S1_9ASTE|nr:unnamed protein product [Cuscuta campestris]